MADVTSKHRKRPTVRDVARQAGVSAATVSRVINGVTTVDPEMYVRTMKAIEDQHYMPPTPAWFRADEPGVRGSRRRTGNIGAIFFDFPQPFHGRQFYVDYSRGMETACAARGYHPVVETISADSGSQLPRCVAEGKVDGILLSLVHCVPAFAGELSRLFPVVLLNAYVPTLAVDQVLADDCGAGVRVVEYLIELGHRRIAFVSRSKTHPWFIPRRRGYVEAMTSHGLFDPSLLIEMTVTDWSDPLDPFADAIVAIEPRATAVIFSDDHLASMCYRLLKDRGLRIGSDISVISFNNDLGRCESLDPPMASFAVPFGEVAELAAAVLIGRIEGGQRTEDQMQRVQLLPGEIVHRPSVSKLEG